MRQAGFTLVELLVVITIMGILMTIATADWNRMQKKNRVEGEAKVLYADLMAVRLDALYTKRPRSVVISSSGFSVYSSSLTSVGPASSKTFRYPLTWTPASPVLTLNFDVGGLSTAGADTSICVDPDSNLAVTNGAVDSIVVSTARIKLGKREGGSCEVSGITQK